MISITLDDRVRGFIKSSILFWEVARIPFNLAILTVVLSVFDVEKVLTMSLIDAIALGVMAIAVNILYTSSYIPDMVLQISELPAKVIYVFRAGIWFAGTGFAMILAYFSFLDGSLLYSYLFQ